MDRKKGSGKVNRKVKNLSVMIAVSFCAVWAALTIGDRAAFSNSLIPAGVTIEQGFESGPGRNVGRLDIVQGDVVLIHKDEDAGYKGRAGLPVFKGDTIITLEKSRVRVVLKDYSELTMASATKIVITSSIYSEVDKNRRSLVEMGFGKARFFIRKFFGFTQSEFKVKTKTAILGVRGSDFIVRATGALTEVTALKDTVLEVYSLEDLETPLLIEDFERTVIAEDALPSEAVRLSPEEIDDLIIDLEIQMDAPEEEPVETQKTAEGGDGESGASKTGETEAESSVSTGLSDTSGEERESAGGQEAYTEKTSASVSGAGSETGDTSGVSDYEDSGEDGGYEESETAGEDGYYDAEPVIGDSETSDISISAESLDMGGEEQGYAPEVDDIEDDLNDTVREQIQQDIIEDMELPEFPCPPPNPNCGG